MFSANKKEVEIKLGGLTDAPTPLAPTYELWIKRREAWLHPIEGAEQFEEDRVEGIQKWTSASSKSRC